LLFILNRSCKTSENEVSQEWDPVVCNLALPVLLQLSVTNMF
jgi:hypothetical protein